ncbi:MAG TPA: hypothetical protein VMT01_01190, partial [Candidatus Acidoferrum sp.]|nr:hypothetical protein [Candidatus Acidoferrum sp.]
WHWNGTQWTPIDVGATMYVFYSVSMTSAKDGWAVGGWGTLQPENATTTVALHWNGAQWTFVGAGTKLRLYSVCMVNSDDGWAVGALGKIMRWNGLQWIPEYSELIQVAATLSLTLIAAVKANNSLKRAKRADWRH